MNRRLLLPALTAMICLAGVFSAEAAPKQTKKTTAAKPAAAPAATALPGLPTTISVGTVNDIDPGKAAGSKNAPLVMEVFSDYQCPACKQLFTTTLQKVNEEYVNTGKVYLVHRDFPLPMHAYSRVAASYARAAARLGKGEAVELALFQNQEKWEANGDVKGTVAAVLSPAEMKKVEALVEAKTLEPLIEKDKQLGLGYAVNQTPTAEIHTRNGTTIPVIGYVSYENLKTFLDQMAAQK